MTNEPESSTMEASTPSGRSSSKTMPLPGSHGAPHFDKEKPIELLRFIEQMEDLFKEYGVSEDQAKKRYLGKYMDQKTEFEWRAFDTYDSSSSYEEFKVALIDDYPEAKMAGKGDDVIDNMKRCFNKLLNKNVKAVNAPTQDTDVIDHMRSVLSYLEGKQGQSQEAQYVATRRASAENQGQSGF